MLSRDITALGGVDLEYLINHITLSRSNTLSLKEVTQVLRPNRHTVALIDMVTG